MKKISISIYLIVPFIFGLFSVLSFIVSFQITRYCIAMHRSPEYLLAGAGVVFFIISAVIGYFIIRFILKPSEKFIEKVRELPAVKADDDNAPESGKGSGGSSDQMEEFTKIFKQVAHALDIMDARHQFPDVIGKSRVIRQVLSRVVKVAPTESTVFIQGESGTGKELIAKSIVQQSPRRDKPCVSINCSAISPNLMESELFGHERGAFTGAVTRKKGCFEQAHEGTLFLDEIGDMPLELQVKLLRVLQERSFFRVGGDSPLNVDVRIIAATNKKLDALISDGSFREDLFYRINVFPISIPPLRERPGDLEPLAGYFLELAAPGKYFAPAAMDLLKGYAWPGNVRELENIVERAAVMAGDRRVVQADNLPAMLQSPETMVRSFSESVSGFKGVSGQETKSVVEKAVDEPKNAMNIDKTLKEIEKSLICEALKKTGGVQVKAANKLGINQRSLWNRIKKFGIDVDHFKFKNMG